MLKIAICDDEKYYRDKINEVDVSDAFINAFSGNLCSEEYSKDVEERIEELENNYEDKMERWGDEYEDKVDDWMDNIFG